MLRIQAYGSYKGLFQPYFYEIRIEGFYDEKLRVFRINDKIASMWVTGEKTYYSKYNKIL
jgi:hypothetical protein